MQKFQLSILISRSLWPSPVYSNLNREAHIKNSTYCSVLNVHLSMFVPLCLQAQVYKAIPKHPNCQYSHHFLNSFRTWCLCDTLQHKCAVIL